MVQSPAENSLAKMEAKKEDVLRKRNGKPLNDPTPKPVASAEAVPVLPVAEVVPTPEVKPVVDKAKPEEKNKKFWGEEKKVEKKEEVKIPLELQAKLKAYQELIDDADFTSFNDFKKNKDKWRDDAINYYKNNPANLSDEDVYKKGLEAAGFKKDKIEEAMLEFEQMTDTQKIPMLMLFREKLENDYKSQVSNSKFNVEESVNKNLNTLQAQENFQKDLSEYVGSLKEKENFGTKVDAKKMKHLTEALENGSFLSKREDGMFDPKEYADMVYLWQNRDEVFENIYKFGEAQGVEGNREESTASGERMTKSVSQPVSDDINTAMLSGKERYERNLKPALSKV